MKKLSKKIVMLALVITMLLTAVLPAMAAAPKLAEEETVASITFPEEWFVYGLNEKIDQSIMGWLGQTEESMEALLKESNAFVFAVNDTHPSYLMGVANENEAKGSGNFSDYSETDCELFTSVAKQNLESQGLTVETAEFYPCNDLNYFYTIYKTEGNLNIIEAITIEHEMTYDYSLFIFEEKDKEVLDEQFKEILASIEYAFNEPDPVPTDYEFEDIGIKFTLDDYWYIAGQDIEKDDLLLELLGISEKEYEESMEETDRYVYGARPGKDVSYSLYIYAMDASIYKDFNDYETEDLKALAKENLENMEETLPSVDEIEDFDALYSGYYETDETKYAITSVYIKYDDGYECVENCAVTIIDGTYYEYYYYEHEDGNYKTKYKDDLENFKAFLDTVEYSEPEAELTEMQTSASQSGPTLEEDIKTVRALRPHFEGLEKSLMDNIPFFFILAAPVVVLGILAGIVVAIVHFAVKSKRRKAKAAAQSADNE